MRRARDSTILRPVNGARFDSARGWEAGEEKTAEAITNKHLEWKRIFTVRTYMKQIKMKGHTKLLRRYTKRAPKIVIGFLNQVITFKKCPIFFQNWGGWGMIESVWRGPTRGEPDKKQGDRHKIP